MIPSIIPLSHRYICDLTSHKINFDVLYYKIKIAC